MKITLYKNSFETTGMNISVETALKRIREGAVKDRVLSIRDTQEKEKRDNLKKKLSAVTFSGTFKERYDDKLIEHSGLMSLDFDKGDMDKLKDLLQTWEYTYAFWISPSGIGYKVLIKIQDKTKHLEHFFALENDFKGFGFQVDKSCKNVSRLCYESYDPDIFINESSRTYTRWGVQEFTRPTVAVTKQEKETEPYQIFQKLKKWLEGRGEHFVSGNRNMFVMKIAGACSRFGIPQDSCVNYIRNDFMAGDKSFSDAEMTRTVKSAYDKTRNEFDTQTFSNETIVNKKTKVEEKLVIFDPEEKPKDTVKALDVKEQLRELYEVGYTGAETTHYPELDKYWKWVRGEANLFTGMGNCGKSEILYELCLTKSLCAGNKWAIFGPEVSAQQFYWGLVEKLMAQDCTPRALARPSFATIEKAIEFIHNHFFYIDASESATIEYLMKKFMELVIAHGVDGCIIDPWNQMTHDYMKAGGRSDKYLEVTLPVLKKFVTKQNIFFVIVAHPKALQMPKNGSDYKCPDVFDINDGAMWNNMMDNIIVIHRPLGQSDPGDPSVEWHSKKIKVQQRTGIRGTLQLNYLFRWRRYMFSEMDMDINKHPLTSFLQGIVGDPTVEDAVIITLETGTKIKPNTSFDKSERRDGDSHTPPKGMIKNYSEPQEKEDEGSDDYYFKSETNGDAPF